MNVRSVVNGHPKWFVPLIAAAILTAVVTMLGTLALFDRENINNTAHEANAKATNNERRIDVLEERVDIRLKNIEEDVKEIKRMVKDLGS